MKRPRIDKERIVPARPSEPPPEPAAPVEVADPAEPAAGKPIPLYWWVAVVVWAGAFVVLWGVELLGLVYRTVTGG